MVGREVGAHRLPQFPQVHLPQSDADPDTPSDLRLTAIVLHFSQPRNDDG